MSLKSFGENLYLAAILLFLYLFLKDLFPLLGLAVLIMYFHARTDLHAALIMLALCFILWIPLYDTGIPVDDTARIREVHQNYAVAKSGNTKFIIYTDGPAPYDALIAFNGEFTAISSAKSFFGFDFASYMRRKGVYYRMESDEIRILADGRTPRRFLQKKADEIEDPLIRAFVYKTVFNVTDDEMISGSLLSSGGFSYAGIMILIEKLLSFFLDEKKRSYVLNGINTILILFYGFHILLVSMLIRRILRMFLKERKERSGIWIICMILLFRKAVLSAAFLFPLCFALMSGNTLDERLNRYTLLFCVQSILNHKINPADTLFYPFMIRLYGLFWLYGLLIIFMPSAASLTLIACLSRLSLLSDRLCIYGSVLGFGLPFFLVWIFSFYRHECFAKTAFASLCVFLICGLFHPFAEVCFINVGQGDCILIKGPLQSDSVLVDTGKPSQYANVCAALHARGISHIDTFFITHMDADHCGNMERIMDDFHVERTITEHEGTTVSDYLVFHDLNSLDTDDKNQSSLMLAFRLNGLDFVLCGDADQAAEESAVRKYGKMHCDVLKLSHHGSKTGSCDLFLDTLKPQLAIVSAGAYEIYHHPSPETVQRLLKRHIPYLNTRDHGDISFFMIGPLRLLVTADLCFELL